MYAVWFIFLLLVNIYVNACVKNYLFVRNFNVSTCNHKQILKLYFLFEYSRYSDKLSVFNDSPMVIYCFVYYLLFD